jgi:hypothetical protein
MDGYLEAVPGYGEYDAPDYELPDEQQYISADEVTYERIDRLEEKIGWLLSHGYPSYGYDDPKYSYLENRRDMAYGMALEFEMNPGLAPMAYREAFGTLSFEDRVRMAGIPKRFATAEHPDADAYASEVIKGRGIYICGKVGRMKTALASAISICLLRRYVKLRFTSLGKILDEIKDSFNGGGNPIGSYQSVQVLVLDDIGKEEPTGFAVEKLYDILDERNKSELPTIVTTQYKGSSLITRLAEGGNYMSAESIVSRLRQDSVVIELDGPDMRLQA